MNAYLRYMNPAVGIFFLALVSSLFCAGQDEFSILASGRVRDAATNTPVSATIRYASLPTGSIYGVFVDSTFQFTIFGTARYQVTVEAQGYDPATIIIDPRDITGQTIFERDVRLIPSGKTTIRLNRLIFQQGLALIDEASFQELDQLAQFLQDNPQLMIQLEGHTDNVGSAEANLRLSRERVDAVRAYLIKQGVAKNRIRIMAFGGSKPIRNEQTSEAHAMNRRVEVRILRY